MPGSPGAVVVFARRPERGKVKTRLARDLGQAAALALHTAFLRDTLEACQAAGARVLLAYTPGPPPEEVALADEAFQQVGDGFGARFDATLAEARRRVGLGRGLVILGVDTPHLGPDRIGALFEPLAPGRALVGPGTRGGFYALGFHGETVPVAEAFQHQDEIPVLTELLETGGLTVAEAGPFYDLDLLEDLERLAGDLEARRAQPDGWVPPRTARQLTELGLLEAAP